MLLYLFVFRIKVTLNLGDFKSDEINVKVVDNSLVVWAEHEEKPDDHGHVYRYVNRRYMLPRNVDLEQINATMSDKGHSTKTRIFPSRKKLDLTQIFPMCSLCY